MEVEYIKSLKQAKNLKVKDLAEMTGIPESTINNFLSRKTESPSFSMMSKLCIAVGGSLDEMIGLKEIVEKKAEEQSSKELLSSITDIYKEQIEDLKERNSDLKEDKKKMLMLLDDLKARLYEINDGSFEIEDLITPEYVNL